MLAPTHLQNFGVVRESKTLVLEAPFNDPVHFFGDPDGGSDWPGIKVKEPASEKERQRYLVAWSSLPWAPSWDVCEDVGWWKGKWSALYGPPEPFTPSGSRSVEQHKTPGHGSDIPARRWGGWYDALVSNLSDIEVVRQPPCVSPGTTVSRPPLTLLEWPARLIIIFLRSSILLNRFLYTHNVFLLNL
jgi:hypothetical protein